jgi:hypothetical protein
MHHYRLSVEKAQGPDGARVDHVTREWLASDAASYVELSRAGTDSAVTEDGFWSATSQSERSDAEGDTE